MQSKSKSRPHHVACSFHYTRESRCVSQQKVKGRHHLLLGNATDFDGSQEQITCKECRGSVLSNTCDSPGHLKSRDKLQYHLSRHRRPVHCVSVSTRLIKPVNVSSKRVIKAPGKGDSIHSFVKQIKNLLYTNTEWSHSCWVCFPVLFAINMVKDVRFEF